MLENKKKENFYNFTLSDLSDFLSQNLKAKPFVAKQAFSWVYKHKVLDPILWQNVSLKTREFIASNFTFETPEPIWSGKSKDGTAKFLLKLHDGESVETVIIASRERRTLCVSSQVGCAIGCTFCYTGTQGLTRHLLPFEIVGQYLFANKWLEENEGTHITNIVFMGQGEPLHNYDNVEKAVTNFLEPHAFGLGQRRITLSTSGLVPKIKKLAQFPPVNIAISLHAAHDDVRSELMPINKRYDLKLLFEAIKEIPIKAHRWITYEYILISDFNDRQKDIDALAELLHQKKAKINIIPFNEYPGSPYKRPSDEKIIDFQNALVNKGFICTTRASKGNDILAACGQLKTQKEKVNLWEEPLA